MRQVLTPLQEPRLPQDLSSFRLRFQLRRDKLRPSACPELVEGRDERPTSEPPLRNSALRLLPLLQKPGSLPSTHEATT